MAFLFWGETEESREAKKNSIESKLESILKEKGSIHLDELAKLMWGGYNLLTDLQGILEFLRHLEKDGKIGYSFISKLWVFPIFFIYPSYILYFWRFGFRFQTFISKLISKYQIFRLC